MSNKGLLVMDMIEEYIYGKKPLIPLDSRKDLIDNIIKLIKRARNKKIPIIFLNSSFRASDPIYSYINYRSQAMETGPSGNVIGELAPKIEDTVFKKRGFDGFWHTGLDEFLQKKGIKELYLCGCQTDCCVRETAVTGAHLDYDIFIVRDCCQTNREFGQLAALRFLKICSRDILDSGQIKW